jgi:hypothetical protein
VIPSSVEDGKEVVEENISCHALRRGSAIEYANVGYSTKDESTTD